MVGPGPGHALEGRVVLVTGGCRGIGRSIALAMAEAGALVAVNHRVGDEDVREVVRAIEEMGRQAIAVRADVTDPAEVAEMVANVRDEFAPIDVLVNNAGIARPLPLEAVHLATWDATLSVNLRAPFIVTSAVLPEMRARRWGRRLFISPTPRVSEASSGRTMRLRRRGSRA